MATTQVLIKIQAAQPGPNALHLDYVTPDGVRHVIPEKDIQGDTVFIGFTANTGQNYHCAARDIMFDNPLNITIFHNNVSAATKKTTAKVLHGVGATAP